MNFPPHIANAPTPRTDTKIVTFTAISNRQGLARKEYEGEEIDYVSPESMRQLERQLLYLTEVVEKFEKALSSTNKHSPTCNLSMHFFSEARREEQKRKGCDCWKGQALAAYEQYKKDCGV